MSGCFHAKFGGRVEFSNCVHEFEEAWMRVGKANSLDDNLARLIDYGGFVKTFGNINADNVHTKHPFGHLLRLLRLKTCLQIRRLAQRPAHN